ncbi:UNKNOWN [Stylonychia lemnae]|uniref:Uncharacterized protein n=1 Tax=Stylonychia lemnae TaxID=5949 RepID=A0A078AZT3_STYLE|nr:UNKNOWN [Stylonychia lemnae]|eukprot:CDW87734.1 UNKNOWN [Stylonychia lemnae]
MSTITDECSITKGQKYLNQSMAISRKNSITKHRQNKQERLLSLQTNTDTNMILYNNIQHQVNQIDQIFTSDSFKKKILPKPFKITEKKLQEIETEKFLNGIQMFKPPVKESSKFIKFFRNQNPCHDVNNEKPSSTRHGHFLDQESLFKMGQVTIGDLKQTLMQNNKEIQNKTPHKYNQTTQNFFQKRSNSHIYRNNQSLQYHQTIEKQKQSFLDQVQQQQKFEDERVKKQEDFEQFKILLKQMQTVVEQVESENNLIKSDQVELRSDEESEAKIGQDETNRTNAKQSTERWQDILRRTGTDSTEIQQIKKMIEQPWQIYLKQKMRQLVKVERKFDESELQKQAEEDFFLKKLLKFRAKDDISFLEQPVDQCMQVQFFKKDDQLMKFYGQKYRFEMKEIRPFGGHTMIKELNPVYNDEVYVTEMRKFMSEQHKIQKQQKQRFFEMQKDLNKTSFMQPLKTQCNFSFKNRSKSINSEYIMGQTSKFSTNPFFHKNQSMMEKYNTHNREQLTTEDTSGNIDNSSLKLLNLDSVNSHNRDINSTHYRTFSTELTLYPNSMKAQSSPKTIQLLEQAQLNDKITEYQKLNKVLYIQIRQEMKLK